MSSHNILGLCGEVNTDCKVVEPFARQIIPRAQLRLAAVYLDLIADSRVFGGEEAGHVDEGYAVLAADADGVYRVVNMPRKVEYVFLWLVRILYTSALCSPIVPSGHSLATVPLSGKWQNTKAGLPLASASVRRASSHSSCSGEIYA